MDNLSMRERFEKKFPKNPQGGMQYTYRDYGVKDREMLLDFIQSEVSRAVREREEQIVKSLNELFEEPFDLDESQAIEWKNTKNNLIENIITLITSKSHESKP